MTIHRTEETREAPKTPSTRPPRADFLERVAHELRGPAGVTLGALEELELALQSAGQASEGAALFAMARRGVKRILRTADRLSRTAQLEAGRTTMSPTSTDLRALLVQVTAEVEELESRRAVKVEQTLPANPCLVMVDASWLQVALAELLAQAVRAAKQRVTVDLRREAGVVRIAVGDDGRPRAPEPAHDASRREGGFPASFAAEVVRAHGGQLSTESSASGTLVTVQL